MEAISCAIIEVNYFRSNGQYSLFLYNAGIYLQLFFAQLYGCLFAMEVVKYLAILFDITTKKTENKNICNLECRN